ncbi:MarR family winged helix-turn-helix transcriptional regulator [Pikeienuella sp. HZG-20]|uniref:MarR family winged helix-turn-helix transcriptional regulator n=1 Tax=Paludibacillus litoralis TaxID=3133267 RepID=UPI0030EB4554
MSGSKSSARPQDLTRVFETVEFRDAYRISYLANAIVIPTYDEIRRRFGIIRGEYLLILCLAHFPVLTAQDVARMSRRPRSSISRAVARMLAENYIERVPDPDDGRQAHLTITAEGRALHEKIVSFFLARQEEVLAALDRDERRTLDALLEKLTRHAATLKT